jgi:ribosomal-protein-alanine N-acetyltransferase
MYKIRFMARCDLPIATEIERRCFEFPWLERHFINCLRQRNSTGVVVEEAAGDVIGYMIYTTNPHVFHLLSIAVHPEFSGIGAGRALWAHLLGNLTELRPRIITEVRESNLKAQQWFRKQGCMAVHVMPEFYCCSGEDAYLFEFDAIGHSIVGLK